MVGGEGRRRTFPVGVVVASAVLAAAAQRPMILSRLFPDYRRPIPIPLAAAGDPHSGYNDDGGEGSGDGVPPPPPAGGAPPPQPLADGGPSPVSPAPPGHWFKSTRCTAAVGVKHTEKAPLVTEDDGGDGSGGGDGGGGGGVTEPGPEPEPEPMSEPDETDGTKADSVVTETTRTTRAYSAPDADRVSPPDLYLDDER